MKSLDKIIICHKILLNLRKIIVEDTFYTLNGIDCIWHGGGSDLFWTYSSFVDPFNDDIKFYDANFYLMILSFSK